MMHRFPFRYVRSYLLMLSLTVLLGAVFFVAANVYLADVTERQYEASLSYLSLVLDSQLSQDTTVPPTLIGADELDNTAWLTQSDSPTAVLQRASLQSKLQKADLGLEEAAIWFPASESVLNTEGYYVNAQASDYLQDRYGLSVDAFGELLSQQVYFNRAVIPCRTDTGSGLLYVQTMGSVLVDSPMPVLFGWIPTRAMQTELEDFERTQQCTCFFTGRDGACYSLVWERLEDSVEALTANAVYHAVPLSGIGYTLGFVIPRAVLWQQPLRLLLPLGLLLVICLTLGFLLAAWLGRKASEPAARLTKLLAIERGASNNEYVFIEAALKGLLDHNRQMQSELHSSRTTLSQQQLQHAVLTGEDVAELFPTVERYVGAIVGIRSAGPQFATEPDAETQIESAICNVAQEMVRGQLFHCEVPGGLYLLLGCDSPAANGFAEQIQSLMLFFEELLEVQLEAVTCCPVEGSPAAASRCWHTCREMLLARRLATPEARFYSETWEDAAPVRDYVVLQYAQQVYSRQPGNLSALIQWCLARSAYSNVTERITTLYTITIDALRQAGISSLPPQLQRLPADEADLRSVLPQLWTLLDSQPEPELYHGLVNEVKQYLQQHEADPNLSIGQMAQALHYNHSHMTRLFKYRTGQSPLEYLLELRIAKARTLLLQGCSVKEAAPQCGYLDARALTAAFKRVEGVTPTQWLAIQQR